MPGDGLPAPGDPIAMPVDAMPEYRPRWDVAVDALMLWQGNATSVPTLVDAAGATAIDLGTLPTALSAGPRVSLIRFIGDCYAIEGNFFQVRPFAANGRALATGEPYTLVNAGDLVFDDIESATATGSGMIQSAELNWRRNDCGSPITWLAGFRWVELTSRTNLDYTFANPDPFGSGSVGTVCGNNLYGGQVGADVRLWNTMRRWRVNGIGKAGLFGNANAYQRSTAGFVTTEGEEFPLGTVSASQSQVAFFGEVGVNSTYWITHWLAWRAGYTVFWAAGVATAAEQLPLNSFGDGTATINTTGSVMLHGVTTGFEARW